nr:MAG TPA: hypothetical protein [Bacteriophage sp.]
MGERALLEVLYSLIRVSTSTRYSDEDSLLSSFTTGLASQSSPFSPANNSKHSCLERQVLKILIQINIKFLKI